MNRPSFDQTFLDIAEIMSRRGTCPRLKTGAVIVTPDNHIITTGYNGSPRGEPHCTDIGCMMINGHCERTIHAEMNAILQAARIGVSVSGCTMYALHQPCRRCLLLATQVGIKWIVFRHEYGNDPWRHADETGMFIRRHYDEG